MSKTKSWAASVLLASLMLILSFTFVACGSNAARPHTKNGATLIKADTVTGEFNVYFGESIHTSEESTNTAFNVIHGSGESQKTQKGIIANNEYNLFFDKTTSKTTADAYSIQLSVYGGNPYDTTITDKKDPNYHKQTSTIWSTFYNAGISEYAATKDDLSVGVNITTSLPTSVPTKFIKKSSFTTKEQKQIWEDSWVMKGSDSDKDYYLVVKNGKGDYGIIHWKIKKAVETSTSTS